MFQSPGDPAPILALPASIVFTYLGNFWGTVGPLFAEERDATPSHTFSHRSVVPWLSLEPLLPDPPAFPASSDGARATRGRNTLVLHCIAWARDNPDTLAPNDDMQDA